MVTKQIKAHLTIKFILVGSDGKDQRLIVIHAGGVEGHVDGVDLIFHISLASPAII